MSTETTFVADLGQLCGRCVPDVLETMFFAMGAESPEAEVGPDRLSVRVDFWGSPSGVFTLTVDRAAVVAMGTAFLGKFDEEELSEAEVAQVAGELANIICGSVLSEAESATGFELDEPRVEAETDGAVGADYQAKFELDTGGGLEVRFRLGGPLSRDRVS